MDFEFIARGMARPSLMQPLMVPHRGGKGGCARVFFCGGRVALRLWNLGAQMVKKATPKRLLAVHAPYPDVASDVSTAIG